MIRLLEVSQVCIAYFKWLALMAMFLEDIRGGRFIRTDDELKFHLYTGWGLGGVYSQQYRKPVSPVC